MSPLRSDFGKWKAEKVALHQARVGHLQLRHVDYLAADSHNIYIDNAVEIIAIVVAMRTAAV